MNLTSPANLLIAGIYYVFAVLLSFFSLFGVYILIRYGKSTPLALVIAVVYAFFFLQILVQSHLTLAIVVS